MGLCCFVGKRSNRAIGSLFNATKSVTVKANAVFSFKTPFALAWKGAAFAVKVTKSKKGMCYMGEKNHIVKYEF